MCIFMWQAQGLGIFFKIEVLYQRIFNGDKICCPTIFLQRKLERVKRNIAILSPLCIETKRSESNN